LFIDFIISSLDFAREIEVKTTGNDWTKTGILCLPTKWLRVAMRETDWIVSMPTLAMIGFEHYFDNPAEVGGGRQGSMVRKMQ
jgi:hypothetical protein